MEPGYEKGDICFRDGCMGTIDAHDKEGCCSCHINPPCGYCTTQVEFCPSCEWDAREEYLEAETQILSSKNHKYYEAEREKYHKMQMEFNDNYHSQKVFNTFDVRRNAHTHFSMELHGWFPLEMTREELLQKIRGTFGGRFVSYNEKIGRFKYIAYTD